VNFAFAHIETKPQRLPFPGAEGSIGHLERPDTNLWVVVHFWRCGVVDLYPVFSQAEPTVEEAIEIIGDNWGDGDRLEPYGSFQQGDIHCLIRPPGS
jgi:hypothetical protein